MTNSVLRIRPMTQGDVNRVVDLHLQVFEGFFLAFLGPRFLATLYSAIVEDSTGISFIAYDDHDTYGFVVGTTEAAGFYRRLIEHRLWRFCIASFQPVVNNPRILPRLFRALSMPQNAALQDANLFVLPSRSDAFPMSVVEACLMALPMVITDRCEIADLVKGQIADVVPFDAQEFSLTMDRLLDDKERYDHYKSNCHKILIEKFSIEAVVNRLELVCQHGIEENRNKI